MNGTSIRGVLCLCALAGCAASPTPELQSGPDAEVTFDGLVRADNTIMDSVWARPDIDITGYRKVLFVPLGVSYRDVDRRAAQQQSGMIESNRVSNAAEIRRLGRHWGSIVREGLESLLTGDSTR